MGLIYFESLVGKLKLVSKNNKLIEISFVNKMEKDKEILDKCLKKTIEELSLYFSGNLKEFSIPLEIDTSDFQKKALLEIMKVPYGEVATYKEIASSINNEKAYRAVGNACNKNKIPIIIPCHRIVGSSGNLVGYAGGIKIKETLLKLEVENRVKI